ncbi:hypothetical protein MRX96_039390 [Rhipicephalus microplus]
MGLFFFSGTAFFRRRQSGAGQRKVDKVRDDSSVDSTMTRGEPAQDSACVPRYGLYDDAACSCCLQWRQAS